MNQRWYISLIVVIAVVLTLFTTKVFSLEELSLFLTVIGLIYGLIAAFTINNAWERYSKIRDAIAEETSSLLALYYYMKQLSDKKRFEKFREEIISYSNAVPNVEWSDYWKAESIHEKFRNIQQIIAGVKLKTGKENALFQCMTSELGDATSARTTQLILAQTRITKLQWTLNIFLSAILLLGLAFLYTPSAALTPIIIAAMMCAVMLILLVIYEIDALRISDKELFIEPYYQLVKIIGKDMNKSEEEISLLTKMPIIN
jgi:hypothetical protein